MRDSNKANESFRLTLFKDDAISEYIHKSENLNKKKKNISSDTVRGHRKM